MFLASFHLYLIVFCWILIVNIYYLFLILLCLILLLVVEDLPLNEPQRQHHLYKAIHVSGQDTPLSWPIVWLDWTASQCCRCVHRREARGIRNITAYGRMSRFGPKSRLKNSSENRMAFMCFHTNLHTKYKPSVVTGKRANIGTHCHFTVQTEVEAQHINSVHGSEERAKVEQSATQVKNTTQSKVP